MTNRYGIATNYASGLRYWVEVDATGDIIRARYCMPVAGDKASQLQHPSHIAAMLNNGDAEEPAKTARHLMRCSPVYVEIAA